MKNIVGVRFKKPGKIYFFDSNHLTIEKGTYVIVETAMGDEYGEVVIANRQLPEEKITNPLKDNTLFLSKKDGKYGYVDKKGNVVVEYIYDDATEQNDSGYVAVKKDVGKINSISS